MTASRSHAQKRRRLNRRIIDSSSSSSSETCLIEESVSTPTGLGSHNEQTGSPSVAEDETGCNNINLVCYGTIPAILGKCVNHRLSMDTFAVVLDSADRFRSIDQAGPSGRIVPQYGQMIQGLLDTGSIQLYAQCSLDTELTRRRSTPTYSPVPCALDITVYGPFRLCEAIGSWFQEYDVYLQDPQRCHLDVRYCNPQRLSSHALEACPLVSEVVSKAHGNVHLLELPESVDPLEAINNQENLEEAAQPKHIRASLHRHQKQALAFMLRREMGWSLDENGSDVWQACDSSHIRFFINRITGAHQAEPPPQFCGGIIADPMGLGKTLTMIALAVTDLDGHSPQQQWILDEGQDFQVAATLIVVPQTLLAAWEEQLLLHVEPGVLVFRRHHGKAKLKDIAEINAVNVVLTTYHTLSADWKAYKKMHENIMFSVRWRRIILDEAHLIRNTRTIMASAICGLNSVSRWAVTGTPVQNQLSDLMALLKFIRAYPYDDPKRFDNDISKLWKCGEDAEAVKRLKRLSNCLVLRRAKGTINLPLRHDKRCPVVFSKAERELYNDIRQQTILKIDEALLQESELSTSGAFINFLQQIESMRLMCNLGLQYKTRHDRKSPQDTSEWASVAQETFSIRFREMETIACSQCSSLLNTVEIDADDTISQDMPLFSRCLKYACAECASTLRAAGHRMVCGHTPRCPIAPVSISHDALEETLSHISSKGNGDEYSEILPSKIAVLLLDLKTLPSDVKSIVFSTWRLTLDIIERGLMQAGIRNVRFDGKVPQAQRQPILDQFKSDPDTRVMLLTLQCGAVGLNLTTACRAYLMEPHWNPTIEEQALARIHRIGQTREVTTIRFYIRDSFEEKVMEVQESKKNLAGVLLSGHDGGHADDSLGALQRLRSLL